MLWVLLPLLLHGSQYSGTIRFIEPKGVNGHRRPVPGAPSSGTPRESQAKSRDGTVWGLQNGPWVPCPRDQYPGEIRFIEKHGVQDKGDRHVAKSISDPRVAYNQYSGKILLIEKPGEQDYGGRLGG